MQQRRAKSGDLSMNSPINWAQVVATSLIFAILLAVAVLLILIQVQRSHRLSERRVIEANREARRAEYDRVSRENATYQSELRGLIGEVTQMAKVLREAVNSDDWDPEAHLDLLARYDAELADAGVGSEPPRP